MDYFNGARSAVPNDGRMLVCLEDGVYGYDPQTGEETATATLSLPRDHRLNDGKVSPEGRLWVGTIDTSDHPSETAGLFVLDDTNLELVESGYENANGKAWSPDGTIMYHADTARSTIWQYDYDPELGKLSGKREFVVVDDGNPDGLCADDHGRVYAAIYGGARIDVFEPNGRRIAVVAVPVPNPTSCTIVPGKPNILYITTAYDGMDDDERAKYPLAGAMFSADLSSIF